MHLQDLLQNSGFGALMPNDSRRLIWQFVWEGQGLYVVEHCVLDGEEPFGHIIKVIGIYRRLAALREGAAGAYDIACALAAGHGRTWSTMTESPFWCPSPPIELRLRYESEEGHGEVRVTRHRSTAKDEACVILQEPSDLGWAEEPLKVACVVSKEDADSAARRVFEDEARDANGHAFYNDGNKVASELLFGGRARSGSRSPCLGRNGLLQDREDLRALPPAFLPFDGEVCAAAWAESRQADGSLALRFRSYNPATWRENEEFELLVWSEMQRIQ